MTCGTDCFTDDAALCDAADCADVALAAACPEKCGPVPRSPFIGKQWIFVAIFRQTVWQRSATFHYYFSSSEVTPRMLAEMEPTPAHVAFRAAMKDATLDAKYTFRRGASVHQAKARR